MSARGPRRLYIASDSLTAPVPSGWEVTRFVSDAYNLVLSGEYDEIALPAGLTETLFVQWLAQEGRWPRGHVTVLGNGTAAVEMRAFIAEHEASRAPRT